MKIFTLSRLKAVLPLLLSCCICTAVAQTPEKILKDLGITLPEVKSPANSYTGFVRTGQLIFLSGKGPLSPTGQYITGKFGRDLTVEQGYAAARAVAIGQLAELKAAVGNLSKVKRIVMVNGFINSSPDFTGQSQVMNGFSDLMLKVFGAKGKHARTSVGVISLPFDMCLEVQMVAEVQD